MDTYQYLQVQQHGDVFHVRLKKTRLEEQEIYHLGTELADLCENKGCRKMVLSLGPTPPECLYSVFLARLVSLRNLLRRLGGQLVLCDAAPVTYQVFEACLLHREFHFLPNSTEAETFLQTQGASTQ